MDVIWFILITMALAATLPFAISGLLKFLKRMFQS